jgi:hypothetical protein
MTTTERGRLLQDAAAATEGQRASDYGTPKVNLGERTADLWDAYLRHRDGPVDGRDVCIMQILVKVARLVEGDGAHRDSWLDIAGYAAAGWEITSLER